jgi:ribonuclease HI
VELFTDGSCCHENPGPGGWAFILRHSKSRIERVVSGGIGYTSTERMEMIAAINGLRSLKRACRVTLYTDCRYVVDGITQRVADWKRFGWRKSVNSTQFVRNADLWMHLAKQCSRHTVQAIWVKGHAGHPENERCDKLARAEAKKAYENLENSAAKESAGAGPLLADWVSTVAPSTAAPTAAKPVKNRSGDAGAASQPAAAADRAAIGPPPVAKVSGGKVATPAAVRTTPVKKDSPTQAALFPGTSPKAPAAPPPAVKGPIVDLFTDGACIGNPGPGGWAFILRHRTSKIEKVAAGGVARTTNNRMEIMAVIQGLTALKRACNVNLFTDSQYVAKGISEWSPRWKKFGWRKTPNAKLQVRNFDLWARLDELGARHTIVPKWVEGHAGHPENERCDQMAQREADKVARNPDKAPKDVLEDGED